MGSANLPKFLRSKKYFLAEKFAELNGTIIFEIPQNEKISGVADREISIR